METCLKFKVAIEPRSPEDSQCLQESHPSQGPLWLEENSRNQELVTVTESLTFEDISEKALHAKPSWIWEQNAENEELKVEESEVTTWPVIIPEESHPESWSLGIASSYPDTRAVKLWRSE